MREESNSDFYREETVEMACLNARNGLVRLHGLDYTPHASEFPSLRPPPKQPKGKD